MLIFVDKMNNLVNKTEDIRDGCLDTEKRERITKLFGRAEGVLLDSTIVAENITPKSLEASWNFLKAIKIEIGGIMEGKL